MNWKFLFFSLKGRISRTQWWIGQLVLLAATFVLTSGLFWLVGISPDFYWNDEAPSARTALVELAVFIVTIRVFLAVDIKRIHDRHRTAYLLVPLYLFELLMLYADGTGTDLIGDYVNPEIMDNLGLIDGIFLAVLIIPFLAFVVYFIWMITELGFRRGTDGPSKYGPDPLAPLTEPVDEAL